MDTTTRTWILADHGKIGTYSQCLGIAQALGTKPLFKSMKARLPWRVLPPHLWFGALHAQTRDHDPLTPPWPDLLIAAGRASVAPALAIQKRHKGCFSIILQNPYFDPRHFGCVIAPYHDHLKGANVIPVSGSLHRLSEAGILAAAQAWPRPENGPITTLLLGGNNRRYHYKEPDIKALADTLKKIGGHCFITPSRRTPPSFLKMLREFLKGFSCEIWDGTGENPYLAYLGLADQIIVSQDSISMASEACFTGKPVYIWEINQSPTKFREFHKDLYTQGYAQPLQWPFPQWHPRKLDEISRIIPLIKEKLSQRL